MTSEELELEQIQREREEVKKIIILLIKLVVIL